MCLFFRTASSLSRFEASCDRTLPSYAISATAPTLEQLRDLGLITAPKLVGSFLLDGRTESMAPSRRARRGSSDDDTDEQSEAFLLSGGAEPSTLPIGQSILDRLLQPCPPPLATHVLPLPGVEAQDDNSPSATSIVEVASCDTPLSDLSDLSDLDVTSLDADDVLELLDEVPGELDPQLCDISPTSRFEFPGSFI